MEGKISAASKQPLERVPRYKAISQKSSVEGEAAAKWINGLLQKHAGGKGGVMNRLALSTYHDV